MTRPPAFVWRLRYGARVDGTEGGEKRGRGREKYNREGRLPRRQWNLEKAVCSGERKMRDPSIPLL